ncbi:hypothetical protein LMG10661_01715 [Ralstonia syzygii subsp. syzygii]|nr:hypothetical protein LMG10661_01715 [Ralstonia syzygii subsp. syzygii]
MPTYLVLTPLLLGDDIRVEAGETVDLKVKDARELLAVGAISKDLPEPASAAAPKPAPTPAPAPEPVASATSATGDVGETNTSQTGTGTEQSTTPPPAA